MSQTLERLRELGGKKTGEPMPAWMPLYDWADPLSALCRDAADEIEKMQVRMKRVNEIVHVPTPSGTKAYTHFMRDFDEIRALTKEYAE